VKEKKREIRRRKEEVLCCVVNESFATSVFFGTSCVFFFNRQSKNREMAFETTSFLAFSI